MYNDSMLVSIMLISDFTNKKRKNENYKVITTNNKLQNKMETSNVLSKQDCSICQDPIFTIGQISKITIGACGHSFHNECMKKWTKSRGMTLATVDCPFCRVIFSTGTQIVKPAKVDMTLNEIMSYEIEIYKFMHALYAIRYFQIEDVSKRMTLPIPNTQDYDSNLVDFILITRDESYIWTSMDVYMGLLHSTDNPGTFLLEELISKARSNDIDFVAKALYPTFL